MGMLRLLTRHRRYGGVPSAVVDGASARSLHHISVVFWAPPDPSKLRVPTVQTCADIPWAMMHIDTWPDSEARFEAQAFLNRRWCELRCCDRPVPFGCDELPYPGVPSQIDWSP